MSHSKKLIIIWGTTYYCGGSIVLAELCRSLRFLGYDARLFLTDKYPTANEASASYYPRYLRQRIRIYIKILLLKILPLKFLKNRFKYDSISPAFISGCKVSWLPFYKKSKTILLYPEFVYGNPLNAIFVTRWLLYNYKFWGDHNAYSQSDLFIGYRDVFLKDSPIAVKNIVTISSFDESLYRRYNFGKREGKCYLIRKGKSRNDLPDSYDGIVVDDLSEEEKVKVFNECEYCYSYDTQTAYSTIAALCGCLSVVVLEPGKTRADYLHDDDIVYGVAYGDSEDEISYANKTRPLISELNKKKREENIRNAMFFVEAIENYFDVKIKRI